MIYSLGDIIECDSANDMVTKSMELDQDGVTTDFIYKKDGEDGYWLQVVNKAGSTNGVYTTPPAEPDLIDRKALLEELEKAEKAYKTEHMEEIYSPEGDPFCNGILSAVFNIRKLIVSAEKVKR